ncbi:AAA family ATPase [soil metagenome]
MSDLLIVAGPPGSGKSTVAALLADRHQRSILVEGDTFFTFLRRGAIDPWRPESNAQNEAVTRAAGAATGRFAATGVPTVYDGVLGPWSLPEFLAATGLDGADWAVLLPPREVCLERVASRRGHGFNDAEAGAHMHAQFADAPIDPRHVVDILAAPDEVADVVAERAAAGLLHWPAAEPAVARPNG